jgi:hypothetical protein
MILDEVTGSLLLIRTNTSYFSSLFKRKVNIIFLIFHPIILLLEEFKLKFASAFDYASQTVN